MENIYYQRFSIFGIFLAYLKMECEQLDKGAQMRNGETLVQKLSFYGRLADEITRDVIPSRLVKVSIPNFTAAPLYKNDGFFTFADIPPSTGNYPFHLTATDYQSRRVEKNLPADSPVELSFHGEDEFYVFITDVQGGANPRVKFDQVPFLKTIPSGADVYGQDGFSATLTEVMEGEGVEEAKLNRTTDLSDGEILRFVRSHNLIMRPGPYYSFDPGTTVIQLKVQENGAGEQPPVPGAVCVITHVNDQEVDSTPVGDADVKTVSFTGGEKLVLGTEKDITCTVDDRGKAVFYYPADTPITKLTLKVTAPRFQTLTPEIAVTPGDTRFQTLALTMV